MICAAGFKRRTPSKSGCKFRGAHAPSRDAIGALANPEKGIAVQRSWTYARFAARAQQTAREARAFPVTICSCHQSPLEKLYESTDGDRDRREGSPHQFGFGEVWHLHGNWRGAGGSAQILPCW